MIADTNDFYISTSSPVLDSQWVTWNTQAQMCFIQPSSKLNDLMIV